MYINKKTKPFSRSFSAFSPFQPFLIKQVSLLQPFLRLVVAASLNKTLKTHKTLKSAAQPTNPQSPVHPQTLRVRRTHNLKSEALLLIQSTRRRGAALLFHSKSVVHSQPQIGGASSLLGRLGGASSYIPF